MNENMEMEAPIEKPTFESDVSNLNLHSEGVSESSLEEMTASVEQKQVRINGLIESVGGADSDAKKQELEASLAKWLKKVEDSNQKIKDDPRKSDGFVNGLENMKQTLWFNPNIAIKQWQLKK